jgi:hypothetical protein
MRQPFISGLLTLQTLLLSFPAMAQTAQTQDCASTLQTVKNTIETGRNVSVVNIRTDNLPQFYSSYPSGRPIGYVFPLLGEAAPDIMHSPQFMNILSRNIIRNCRDVSQITFGVYGSDWIAVYGLVNDDVVAFDCIEPRRRIPRTIAWGYHVCL